MSHNTALEPNNVLLDRMQRYRLNIIEDILEPDPDKPQERIVEKDPKMIRVALTAMDGVDNSIHKQSRLDLDKKAQENDGDFQRQIAGAINLIMEKGGMALNDGAGTTEQSAAPAPQLNMLPGDTISDQEAHVGVEHIEYDDIMTKRS